MKEKTGVPVFTPVDTPEMVEYCLNCPWTDCWDCLGKKNKYSMALRLELGVGWNRREIMAIKGEKA